MNEYMNENEEANMTSKITRKVLITAGITLALLALSLLVSTALA